MDYFRLLQRYKDHIFVCFLIWLMMTLMFVESTFGDDYYVSRDLVYFWDFNDELNYESDRKLNVNGSSQGCLLYTSPSPRDATLSRMPSSA